MCRRSCRWRRSRHYSQIDEAQDISIAHLRFFAALGANRPNALFFAGDLGQRIFQQPFSWRALGVDIRGRSRTLRVNYRTSHQIRVQADRLLGPEVTDVDGNSDNRSDTISVFNGPPPAIQILQSEADESSTVSGWLFDEKRIVRMEDNKLLTDICYALLNGISTTKKPQLDKIYKDKDKEFPEADLLSGLIRQAFATLGTFEELQKGVLMKPYNIYALVLALIHTTNPQEILTKSYANSHLLPRARSQNAQQQLTELVDAIVREDFEGKYGLFVKACKERTNVGEQRATRFSFFCNALIGA